MLGVKGDGPMISVFDYIDYREFLKAFCEEKRRTTDYFSYRWLSKRAGLNSTGFLTLVLNGRKNITPLLARSIAAALKFDRKAKNFFVYLVQYNQAGSPDEKIYFFDELLRIRPPESKALSSSQSGYYGSWFHGAIRELVTFAGFDGDFGKLAGQLYPRIKTSEVKESVELLERLLMIRKKKDGGYEQTDPLLTSDGAAIDQLVIRQYQSKVIELALNALHEVHKENRDISTITLSVDKENFERIRRRTEQYRAEILSIARSCASPDRVYQLNIQLFPLSGREPKKGAQ